MSKFFIIHHGNEKFIGTYIGNECVNLADNLSKVVQPRYQDYFNFSDCWIQVQEINTPLVQKAFEEGRLYVGFVMYTNWGHCRYSHRVKDWTRVTSLTQKYYFYPSDYLDEPGELYRKAEYCWYNKNYAIDFEGYLPYKMIWGIRGVNGGGIHWYNCKKKNGSNYITWYDAYWYWDCPEGVGEEEET